MGKGSRKLIRSILVESLSEDHVKVIEALSKPRYDEDIADELKIKATVVRTILNDLHLVNLVEYDRSKNKKTGWYTYLWKRRDSKVDEYINDYLQKKLIELTTQLEEEKKGMKFACKCSLVPFETALETDFTCTECLEPLIEHDNSELIDRLVTDISEIRSLLEQT